MAIQVAPASVERALRIIDALVKALFARGLQVDVLDAKNVGVWLPGVTLRRETMPVTLMQVDGESIPFAIEEVTESAPVDRSDPARWGSPLFERRRRGFVPIGGRMAHPQDERNGQTNVERFAQA